MATQNSTDLRVGIDHPFPARRLIAAGIKRGAGPLVVEQPQLSAADKAAHVAASHVRPVHVLPGGITRGGKAGISAPDAA